MCRGLLSVLFLILAGTFRIHHCEIARCDSSQNLLKSNTDPLPIGAKLPFPTALHLLKFKLKIPPCPSPKTGAVFLCPFKFAY